MNLHQHIKSSSFDANFEWGVAISALQNEGAYLTDGKGLSNWDVFSRRIGKIKNGAKPTNSCDFYHRYKDDLMLVKALGFKVFRFSISWSRILPEGIGRVNKQGLDFYHRLIDECLILGIRPYITLYHWDLPYALEKEGGWANHQMLKWFSRYVKICTDEFGYKVKDWIVINEPMGFTSLGYMVGKHAPGKTSLSNFMSAIHNTALCNAEGGRIIRAEVNNAHIGTCFSCSEVIPYKEIEVDIMAAKSADALLNRLFIEPVLGRGYPEDQHFPFLEKLHLHTKAWKYKERMQFNFDFIGIQNYFSLTVKYNPLIPYLQASEVKANYRKVPHTALGWEINAESFYRMIKRFWHYGGVKEIIITEGGAAFKDHLHRGKIEDVERIDYFKQYINAVLKAKKDGVNVNGYFAWTLTDNFEWSEGFDAKFGLVHVDFATQSRTIKDSGYWFREFLRS